MQWGPTLYVFLVGGEAVGYPPGELFACRHFSAFPYEKKPSVLWRRKALSEDDDTRRGRTLAV